MTTAIIRELTVVVYCVMGRDGDLISGALQRAGIGAVVVRTADEFLQALELSPGAAVCAEEALTPELVARLQPPLQAQPTWSDFPIIVFTTGGEVTRTSEQLAKARGPLGNVTLLERPVRMVTLVSATRTALRARQRQYQIRDYLTERENAERALRRTEKLAAAGRLAATIAHEINNPLEAVTNLLFLARQESDVGPVCAGYLEQADRELSRVTYIARQTLGFYRDTSKPGAVAVRQLVGEVMEIYARRCLSKALEVRMRCDDAIVRGYPGELRQVVSNLITNAIDASPKGGKIHLRTRETHSQAQPGVWITVADSGPGIAPQHRRKIFEPFFTTKESVGTGLGLWASQEIVRKHRGKITLRSRADGAKTGTVFRIFLPLEAAIVEAPGNGAGHPG